MRTTGLLVVSAAACSAFAPAPGTGARVPLARHALKVERCVGGECGAGQFDASDLGYSSGIGSWIYEADAIKLSSKKAEAAAAPRTVDARRQPVARKDARWQWLMPSAAQRDGGAAVGAPVSAMPGSGPIIVGDNAAVWLPELGRELKKSKTELQGRQKKAMRKADLL